MRPSFPSIGDLTNLTNLDTPEFVNGPVLCIILKNLHACARAQVSRLQAHADEEAFWQRGEALATKVGRAHACLSA